MPSESAPGAHLEDPFSKLPLYFIKNQGQEDPRVAYYVHGRDTSLYFTSQGLTFVRTGSAPPSGNAGAPDPYSSVTRAAAKGEEPGGLQRWVVRLDFVGANPELAPEGEEPTPAKISYFKGPRGRWQTEIPTYGSVVYRDVWPGIDLVYTGTVNRLKYSFLVKPGADPETIRLAYRGVDSLSVTDAGELQVETAASRFRDDRPVAYQEVEGQTVAVRAAYAAEVDSPDSAKVYGFTVGDYDRSRLLVLDPAVLVYCGFIGGNTDDSANGIVVDADGNAYIAGYTYSAESTFPETVGPYLTFGGGNSDAFVAKVNPAGTALLYCGYIGGSGDDRANGIAVDGDGNAYVTGYTTSTADTFPETVGPDLFHNGGKDAFVAKVNPAGTALLYCGYIGGSGDDVGQGIAVDGSGNAYIAGYTSSDQDTFPETIRPFDPSYNGGTDAFVAKVNAAGTALLYCGYIGGSGDDYANGIAVDGSGNAYVAGHTNSTAATFPETVGPNLTHNGAMDAFVAKVNSAGSALIYCGYIGGSSNDVGNDIAVDGSDNAYIVGQTYSTEASFPVTVGPDLTHNGDIDAFVAKVNGAGTALVYCGYIGGSGYDYGAGIAVNGGGNAYVTGSAYSSETTFPVKGGPGLTYSGGGTDAFVAKVNAAGNGLVYCGYIGGMGNDHGIGIAVDRSGNAYIAGATLYDLGFPAKVGPDLTYNGLADAFVAKISEGGMFQVLPNRRGGGAVIYLE